MERPVNKTLEDIFLAISEIEGFFDSRVRRFDVYLSDICLRRAIERNITIIGEATNRLLRIAPDIKITAARKIVDTRNYVIHSYDSVTNEIMWGIVINHLPLLKSEIEALLNSNHPQED